jgi:hypothetical protein
MGVVLVLATIIGYHGKAGVMGLGYRGGCSSIKLGVGASSLHPSPLFSDFLVPSKCVAGAKKKLVKALALPPPSVALKEVAVKKVTAKLSAWNAAAGKRATQGKENLRFNVLNGCRFAVLSHINV